LGQVWARGGRRFVLPKRRGRGLKLIKRGKTEHIIWTGESREECWRRERRRVEWSTTASLGSNRVVNGDRGVDKRRKDCCMMRWWIE
jgi:hypothetical protein